MKNLVSGENVQLPNEKMIVQVKYSQDCDVATFCLYDNNKTKGDDDFIFYGQQANQNKTILFVKSPNQTQITVDLPNIAQDICKVALAISYNDQKISTLGNFNLEVESPSEKILSATFNTAARDECALILGEFYRHKGNWKFKVYDQGFNGGLQPLAEFYGVEISEGQGSTNQAAVNPNPTTSNPMAATRSTKISLTKNSPKVSVNNSNIVDIIKVNLNWNKGPFTNTDSGFVSHEGGGSGILQGIKNSKLFSSLRDSKIVASVSNSVSGVVRKFTENGIDLDLAAYVKLNSGEKTIIQALGNRFGSLDQPPFVKLLGDDRSGQEQFGEWLHINGRQFANIYEIIIFTFIYHGVPNWAATDASVKIIIPGEPEIETQLTEGDDQKTMCAIARIANNSGQVAIERINRYFHGHQDMDNAFGWGFNWTKGSK